MRVVPEVDVGGDAGTASQADGDGAWPDRIAQYRILGRLGQGGMGVVYLAEQDEPVRREVALKVLRAGADSDEVIARFASERRALALMEHPNITRVYDGGVTPAGRPYVVMERVTGVPVSDYAAAHRLTTRERVELFVQICRAVQHAHQKGIIHRDLKPSNVIVTEVDGRPVCKVIDFGIAKATSADLRLTATGTAVGTPAYMSPEQFLSSSGDIDTRSDIYSMGVMLYELLTGVLPGAAADGPSWAALLRRADGDFPAASAQLSQVDAQTRDTLAAERGTSPEALRRTLQGDLDCILMKALEPERDARYATAAALAQDLERYLADEAVSARPASASYRIRKFARRHRAGVTLSAVLLVVLVATAVGSTIQARRLAVARSVALSRQEQAERLVKYMLGDLVTKLRPLGRLDVMDDVGKSALSYFAAVPVTTLSDAELFRRAEAYRLLSDVRVEQGRLPEASALAARALALSSALAARDSTKADWRFGLALSEYGVGSLAWSQGRTDDALPHLESFLRISDRLAAQYPDSLSYQGMRAYARINIGTGAEGRGEVSAALASYREAEGLLARLLARDSSRGEWRVAHGAVLNNIGVAQRKLGDLAGALRSHEAEMAERESWLAADPDDANRQRYVAIAHVYRAETRLWRGEVAEALRDLEAARALYAGLVARDGANAAWRLGLANAHRRIAQARLEAGDMDGARRAIADSRTTLAPLLTGAVPNVRAARELSLLDATLAEAYVRGGRAPEAIAPARRASSAGDSALAARPADLERRKQTSAAHLTLGDALGRTDPAAAAREWTSALSVASAAASASTDTELLALRATALVRLGRTADASPIAAELTRRGVARPSVLATLRAPGVATGS